MRNAHDQVTAEIPGLPAHKKVSPQQARILELGYQGPKERDRCETCRFVCGGFAGEPLRCSLGEFPVMRGGLCSQHLPED